MQRRGFDPAGWVPRRVGWFGVMTLLVVVLAWPAGLPLAAQSDAPLQVTIEAGYDTAFRENYWLPLRIRARNEGDPIRGRFVVRPDTSGRVVTNAYSTPIDLPTGSEKTVFLYLLARTSPPEITVELLDDEGVRAHQQRVPISPVLPEDQLYVHITGPTGAALALNAVRPGGANAQQANWDVEHLPDNAVALRAVDAIFITNVDTSAFSTAQGQALADWVAGGGHLIVSGGADWANTAAGLGDLLPFEPDGSEAVDELRALAEYAGDFDAELRERTLMAVGTVRSDEGAYVLTRNEAGWPLIVRREYGAGVVDYLTVDPSLEPLRSWQSLPQLWFSLVSAAPPRPPWTQGVIATDAAATAIAVLPGLSLLPSAWSLIAFLGVYILLIGPVNYLILARLNRREWAWITIPLFIVIFSALAWSVGFNLRGNEVTLSRLNVVEAWPENDEARLTQYVGVLSPRRETYDITLEAGRFARLMPGLSESRALVATSQLQSSARIDQGEQFSAQEIAVDGGIFANLRTEGSVAAPDISGRLRLLYNADNTQSVIGVIRNESDITLENPVILARGVAYRLDESLAPGDLITLEEGDLTLTNAEAKAITAPIEYRYAPTFTVIFRRSFGNRFQTVTDILNENPRNIEDEEDDQVRRRFYFLSSFMQEDQWSTGRGHDVYLAGWSDVWRDDITLSDAGYVPLDTTLYLVKLATDVDQPAGRQVRIGHDQFTWTVKERVGTSEGGANGLNFGPSEESHVVIRYVPVPGAVLDEVDELNVHIDRQGSYSRQAVLSVWDWRGQTWEELGTGLQTDYSLNTARFVGPGNMVELRIGSGISLGSLGLDTVAVSQRGTFNADAEVASTP